MRLVDLLPKFPQYEDFPYARDFICPNCDGSGFDPIKLLAKPNLVGWCETYIGYMGVFECSQCRQKFRFHCTIGTWTADIDKFDYYLYFYAKRCANFEQLQKQLKTLR